MRCEVEKINDNLFKCKNCNFKHIKRFKRDCIPHEAELFQCKYLGKETGKIDRKYCSCSNRQKDFPVHFCEKYKVECGLFSMLNYAKKKELLEKGARNCSTCEDRFT
jgi:hypothetical protein